MLYGLRQKPKDFWKCCVRHEKLQIFTPVPEMFAAFWSLEFSSKEKMLSLCCYLVCVCIVLIADNCEIQHLSRLLLFQQTLTKFQFPPTWRARRMNFHASVTGGMARRRRSISAFPPITFVMGTGIVKMGLMRETAVSFDDLSGSIALVQFRSKTKLCSCDVKAFRTKRLWSWRSSFVHFHQFWRCCRNFLCPKLSKYHRHFFWKIQFAFL